jgi:hypothetical protein
MLIGQSVIAPTTPGAVYFSPWFPRQGDACTAVLEILKTSGGAFSLSCEVQTKNQEQSDASATVLATIAASAVGTATGLVSGCRELVRYKFTATGTSAQQWIHFRSNAPQWQPN